MKHRYLAIGSIIFLILILRKNKGKTPATVTQIGEIKSGDIVTMEEVSHGLVEEPAEDLKVLEDKEDKAEAVETLSNLKENKVLAPEAKEAAKEEKTGIFTTGGNVSTATSEDSGINTDTTGAGAVLGTSVGSGVLTTTEVKPSPLDTDYKVGNDEAIINKLSDIESKIGGIGCCDGLRSHVIDKELEKEIRGARNEDEEVVDGKSRLKVFSREFDAPFS